VNLYHFLKKHHNRCTLVFTLVQISKGESEESCKVQRKTFAQAAAFVFYRRLSTVTEGNLNGVQSYSGVTKICRLSWLTNTLVYEPKCGGGGCGVAESQPMSTAVHRSPNKLWRSNSIFNLCLKYSICNLFSLFSLSLSPRDKHIV
jgi:hypothetical protein